VPSGFPFSLEFRRRLLDRVCLGSAVEVVARQLSVSKSAAHRWWSEAGGMELITRSSRGGGPVVPPRPDQPGGRGHRLSLAERIEIMRCHDAKMRQVDIATRLGRSPATISRELARNRNADGDYHALLADCRAAVRARRPKPFKLHDHPLAAEITGWLDEGWSPKLIAVWLTVRYPDDRLRRVSHETIYQSVYVQTRGNLRADLWRRLSTKRSARKPRAAVERRGKPYAEAFKIAERPPEADDRRVPGHWEGDLILGSGCGSAIGTLVERTTRFTMLLHLPGDHTAETVAAAMIKAMMKLPQHLRRSLTWDRGSELTKYREIQLRLKMPVYFCDPHSPWQRPTNENTNRLLRFWFEKGTDLSVHTAADLARVQRQLNSRPRPTLNLDTPAQRLAILLEQAA
jgi:transposase, IS30 family